MAVNKLWYNFYLSKRFKTISLSLRSSDPILSLIFYSPFQPGQWTTCIRFIAIDVEKDDLHTIDYDNDRLSRLMRHTPKVKTVIFLETERIQAQAWSYFSLILKRNPQWSLRKIPNTWNNHAPLLPFYEACALHVRNTLEKLNLAEGMSLVSNLSLLKDFTALRRLDIGKDIIKDPLALPTILQNTSADITNVAVEFSSNTACIENYDETFPVYPNMKQIVFLDFTPQSNEALALFSDKFTQLEKLLIVGKPNERWPAVQVNEEAEEKFYKTLLHSLNAFQIIVPGCQLDLNQFKKQWKQPLHLYIRHVPLGHYVVGDQYSISLAKTEGSQHILIQYDCLVPNGRSTPPDYSPVQEILQSLGSNDIVQMNFKNEAQNLLAISLVSLTHYENIRTIILSDTRITMIDQMALYGFSYHVKTLKFYNCRIQPDSARKLSALLFKHLDYLLFNTCDYRDRVRLLSDAYNIPFLSTEIKTLCISEVEDPNYPRQRRTKSHPYAIIYVKDVHTRRRFKVNQASVIVETKPDINLEEEVINHGATVIIKIHVKSIKTLILKSPARETDVCIDFNKTYYPQ